MELCILQWSARATTLPGKLELSKCVTRTTGWDTHRFFGTQVTKDSQFSNHSTVTDLARLRGLSTSQSSASAVL